MISAVSWRATRARVVDRPRAPVSSVALGGRLAGRTPGFGPGSGGSSPSPPAFFCPRRQAHCRCAGVVGKKMLNDAGAGARGTAVSVPGVGSVSDGKDHRLREADLQYL